MAFHIDIIKREPLSGTERAIACVTLDDGVVTIRGDDEGYWRETLVRAVGIDPDEHPDEFLGAVSDRLDGTYVFATELHHEADCDYSGTSSPLESVPT